MELFQSLNKEFNFTLDVCADTSNYKVVPYFNEKKNGLIQDWGNNTCFCNPPFGRAIKEWVKKCYSEQQKGSFVVALLPARVDTRWFHDYVYNNPLCEIRFLKGRLKFSGRKTSAPFPSMVVVFHPNKDYKIMTEDEIFEHNSKCETYEYKEAA